MAFLPTLPLTPTPPAGPITLGLQLLLSTYLFPVSGENVREFFFRVAALTFEANVLDELEKSGSRRIGDVVRECPPG